MKIIKKIPHLIVTLALSSQAFASSYTLQMSELFQNCDFVHDDQYSLQGISNAIQASLKAKLEGDKECYSSFNQLNTHFEQINSMMNMTVSPEIAHAIYDETYTNYLVNLTQEASVQDLNNPDENKRYHTLISQIDTLKAKLYNNTYNLELNKQLYSKEISTEFKKNLFSYSKSLFSTLNSTPDHCIGRLGGWGQIIPAVLKVSSIIGSTMGPTGLVVGAGLQASSELSVLLQNRNVKKALSDINRRRNEQILACTYLSLQTTACDLQRAKQFAENKEKVKQIIFRDLENSKFKEFEKFYIALNSLPRIQEVLNAIGSMGSAVTMDVSLITKYFEAVKIRPNEITLPPEDASDSVIQKFILEMKSRGLEISDWSHQQNRPLTLKEQLATIKTIKSNASSVIISVIDILKEKRSFVDLLNELSIRSVNLGKDIKFIKEFLHSYSGNSEFPEQYIGLLKAADRMVNALDEFLSVSGKHGEYEEYVKKVDEKGRNLFTVMSEGSVAQISEQTVLMIPAMAFQRMVRPFKALENYFLNRDIAAQHDPSHVSFTDYMMNESLQVKVINDYKFLTGSRNSFRLDEYETTRKSFEKGFRKEIKRMISDAMKAESEVLKVFEGKTAAHMCALFSPFLKENSPKLFKKCQEQYKSLELLDVLDDFKSKTSMPIDYKNACFYSNYKREETGQRMLFDRLLDYGVAGKRN